MYALDSPSSTSACALTGYVHRVRLTKWTSLLQQLPPVRPIASPAVPLRLPRPHLGHLTTRHQLNPLTGAIVASILVLVGCLIPPRTTHFYHFILPHPDNSAPIVASFLQYKIALKGSEVFGTFSAGYAVHKCTLQPTPVEYDASPLTPEQLRIFDASKPFAYAVSKVVDEYFPYDLLAAVQQYQFYKSTQYSLQRIIQTACIKEMKFAKKALEVLLEMENANVLGCLLVHMDVLSMALAPKPDAHFAYIKVIRGFDGDITETVLDTCVNCHHSAAKEQGEPIPDSVFDKQCAKEQHILDERKDSLEHCKGQCRTHAVVFPLHMRKQCFRCGHFGHIRIYCPRHTLPLGYKWACLMSMTLAPTHPSVRPSPLMTVIVITHASLADCWLILDSSDYPTIYNLATTLFALDIQWVKKLS